MTTKELQEKILELKKEKDFCILAHVYENREITEIADFVGDSFALSKKAAETSNKNVLMCGVRFMAETVKILSPEKNVYISSEDAGCPMAEQLSAEKLREMKRENPDSTVVAYINTTAELKAECDVCVTSASALTILNKIENENIIFIPDINLGRFCEAKVPEKKFTFINGGCPVHSAMTENDVIAAKKKHPDALLLVHPECTPDVVKHSDYAGSTTGIMDFAKKSDAEEFIIGTENTIVTHLQYECPEKRFYPLSKNCICRNMKLTTLPDVYNALNGEGYEIILSDELIAAAKKSIDRMLELG